MRGVDLTPADETVALLLLAAHQRNMRKRHIKRKLAGKSCCSGSPDLCEPGSAHLSTAMIQPDKQQFHHAPQEEGNTQQQQDTQLQATAILSSRRTHSCRSMSIQGTDSSNINHICLHCQQVTHVLMTCQGLWV